MCVCVSHCKGPCLHSVMIRNADGETRGDTDHVVNGVGRFQRAERQRARQQAAAWTDAEVARQ